MKGLRGRTVMAASAAIWMILGTAPAAASAAPSGSVTGGQATSASGKGHTPKHTCVSVRPVTEFYEAGRVASVPLTVPPSRCTTISVSHIKDAANPSDRCRTFLVGFFPADGSEPTYTEPVTACSVPRRTRTVLASHIPDGAVYRILYAVDYIEPNVQVVRYRVWH